MLHPGDFKAERLASAYDKLYRKEARPISSHVESAIASKDIGLLDVLKTQPGNFLRRLHKAYELFGNEAFEAFKSVTDKLTVSQLVKLDAYLENVSGRKNFLIAPKGQWSKAQIVQNAKSTINAEHLNDLRAHISASIRARLDAMYPQGFAVDPAVKAVKLQTNGQALASYGRGTQFSIPEEMKFLRTASYWEKKSVSNTWFDVGWNFFDENWNDLGAVCWDKVKLENAAVFSGDPTNSKDMRGRACQMIDLYPDRLVDLNIRYAVWSVLCFSKIPFSASEEVLATLQWGEKPQKGKLYEPARAQAVFPLTGKSMSKFVAYVDLVERKLVYMDLDLSADIKSAWRNGVRLESIMPAFIENVEGQPSVYDVFKHASQGAIPVVLNDKDRQIDGPAYVFEKTNAENNIEAIDLESILNAKADVIENDLIARFGMAPGV